MEFILPVLIILLKVYEMFILVRIMLSWVPIMDYDHKIIVWLVRVTDPVLLPAREVYMRILDRFNLNIPIDLSPILVFLVIGVLERSLMTLAV
jgi:uncharacterized protein YggT (Ycf19 family)